MIINNEENINEQNKRKMKVKVLYPITEEDSAIEIIEVRKEYIQIIKKAAKSIKNLKLDQKYFLISKKKLKEVVKDIYAIKTGNYEIVDNFKE